MAFMRSPEQHHEYDVADRVEVYCDHDDKENERYLEQSPCDKFLDPHNVVILSFV